MNQDLYIFFGLGIGLILGSALFLLWLKNFEIAVFFFALTPLISAIFFDNLPQENVVMDDATIGIGGTLRAATLILLGIAGIIKFSLNIPKNKLKVPVHFILLSIFLFFSFSSTIYSLDQKFTLIRSGLLFAVFCFLLGLNVWMQENGNLKKAMNSLFVLASIIILATLAGTVAVPSRVWWWKLPRLVGLWEHPNTFGSFCMLTYPILLWKFYTIKSKNKYFILLLIFINMGLHILTGSRTTLLASSAGVLVWLLLEKNWVKLFSLGIALGIFLVSLLYFAPSSFKRNETSEITDLSSREDIWKSAEIFIKEKPIFGYGYGVEGKIFQDELKVDLEGSFIERNVRQSLHNGYLSLLVGVGIVGLILWLLTLTFPFIFSITSVFSPEKAYAYFTFVTVIITNFVESALTGYSLPSDIFYWLAWTILGSILVKNSK
ncbi:MAG: O-antigen ligase family protein [Ignavibacteriales bacterium]|nr:O-antigen ligase family protein [Ignavibacteriales bacterium]MBK7979780.1 O-antigen ligase family protein [Ignavibacteriota bacterium]